MYESKLPHADCHKVYGNVRAYAQASSRSQNHPEPSVHNMALHIAKELTPVVNPESFNLILLPPGAMGLPVSPTAIMTLLFLSFLSSNIRIFQQLTA